MADCEGWKLDNTKGRCLMCGVFGAIMSPGERIDLHRVRMMARSTETRGPDAFGFAWVDDCDRLHRFKSPGRITENMHQLDQLADAKMFIGHCRFATHGDPESNENNHPHSVDGGWMVHNGVVRNAKTLASEISLSPVSDCDSELLGLLIEDLPGTLMDRTAGAVNRSLGELAVLGLWSRPQRMLIAKRGKPLVWQRSKEHGIYLASLPDCLTSPTNVKDNHLFCLVRKSFGIQISQRELKPCPKNDPPQQRTLYQYVSDTKRVRSW